MKGERLGEFEELILLSVCNLGDNAYGVTIQETMDTHADRTASLGAVYAALDRLERKGFVQSWIGGATEERGGRRKRYYRATNTALETLKELRAARTRLWRGIEDLGLSPGTI